MLTEQLKCPVSSEIKDFVSQEDDEYGQLNLRAYRPPSGQQKPELPDIFQLTRRTPVLPPISN